MKVRHISTDLLSNTSEGRAYAESKPFDGARLDAPYEASRTPRISALGLSALLFDVAGEEFSTKIQARILNMAMTLSKTPIADGIVEVTPGLNNLLFVFDPYVLLAEIARSQLEALWERTDAYACTGKEVNVNVVYGGSIGIDLVDLSSSAGMSIDSFVRIHSTAVYSVACLGSYPGFAYLSGLPPALFAPRRQTPRKEVTCGSVIIGGTQAGVMPCTGPSGWHVIGQCELVMFDPRSDQPCLFSPGDRVRFHIERIVT